VLDGKPYFLDSAETYLKAKAGKLLAISGGGDCPVPLGASLPKRPPDMGGLWVEGAEWFYGGVGFPGWRASCICWNTRPALDLFARSFLPEIDHYSVAVLDTNGNLILRIGQYGNVDDGLPSPAVPRGAPKTDGPMLAPPNPRSIGGDEVALMHPSHVATLTDRYLYIGDVGNGRIVQVKLGYHAEEKVVLKDVKDTAKP